MMHAGSKSEAPRRRRRAVAAVAVLAASSLLVAAGGGVDAGGSATTSGSAAEIADVTFAWTSPTQPTFVNRDYGLVEHGPTFGLETTVDDLLTFDSHAVATQAVLSGDADVVGGSFVSNMLVNQQGEEFKAFCPFVKNDDFVLVSNEGIDEIGDLFESGVSVALDSPGGAGDIILNAMLQAAGEERTTSEIPGVQILESSGLRTTAFASGDVDVTLVHLTQYNAEILPAVPDAQIIARLYEDVTTFLKETIAAPSSWIDENLETATAICAAIVAGSRALVEDRAVFDEAVNTYVAEPPESAELDEVYPLINDAFWPIETGITEEATTFMADVAVASGVLEEVPAFEDVVDVRPFEGALELLGDTEPAGTEPAGTGPAGTGPAGTEPTGTEPAGTEPMGTEPATTEPS
jgi:ABC-type nitrate/sulfonate/bicarbonate transport system substrate-binding protein